MAGVVGDIRRENIDGVLVSWKKDTGACPVPSTFRLHFQVNYFSSLPPLTWHPHIPVLTISCSYCWPSSFSWVLLLPLSLFSNLVSTQQQERYFLNVDQIMPLPYLEPSNSVLFHSRWLVVHITNSQTLCHLIPQLSPPWFVQFPSFALHFYWPAYCQFPEPAMKSYFLPSDLTRTVPSAQNALLQLLLWLAPFSLGLCSNTTF